MKNMRKLIPALCLLLVSAMMLGTSTFAWFSMNNKVTVTGMEVKTKVSSSLWIATDTLGSTAVQDENNFKSDDVQHVKAILEPVSTDDGKVFHYTVDALKSGEKAHTVASSAFVQYDSSAAPVGTNSSAYADLFSETYGVTKSSATQIISGEQRAYAYVDYVFQLKATNTNPTSIVTAQIIDLTKLDLIYFDEPDAGKAFRAAIFVEDLGTTPNNPAGGVGDLMGIYKTNGSSNYGGGAIGSNAVVDSSGAFVAADYVSSAVTIGSVSSGETKYFKVVVRLWLEGQDTTCNNDTYATLTDKWTLNLELQLVDSTASGVTVITPHTTNSSGVVTP